jgi:hypothetical protein
LVETFWETQVKKKGKFILKEEICEDVGCIVPQDRLA